MIAQDFEAWLGINENLETSAALIDNICKAVSNTNEISMSVFGKDETKIVIEEEKIPMSAEMRNALWILWLGVQRKADADGFHKHWVWTFYLWFAA